VLHCIVYYVVLLYIYRMCYPWCIKQQNSR